MTNGKTGCRAGKNRRKGKGILKLPAKAIFFQKRFFPAVTLLSIITKHKTSPKWK
jgi:hypothetical protein